MPYRLTQQLPIDEIGCTLHQLEHEGCGAQILHLANDDPENVFCISFQTLPYRSDGAPHILEHTVLCGSEKYPVKDPFFCMIRRSLNTFMNAMTGDDLTFYPAASQVEADFYNLLDVYIDATFFPKLERLSFLQEGHRLEFAKPDDPNSPLVRKGVVYNEMKGALSSSEARGWYRLVSELYPDTPYRFNSGGDPIVIPELSYEELVEFHRTFYHPSRALFFFYGNLPLEHHLKYLDDRLLANAERLPPLPPIPHQTRRAIPRHVTATFPIAKGDSPDGKALSLLGWLTTTVTQPEEVLALAVLDLLLTGTDASPLKLALLKSGLCKDAYAFISPDMADVPFVLVCKGVTDSQVLEQLIFKELTSLAQTGFPTDQIEAAIHQLEFSRTEIQSNSSPYGLKLFRRSGPLVHFGVAPELGLRIHTLFDSLRKQLTTPGTLGKLIHTYLLDNPHWCHLTMEPNPNQGAEEEAQEAEALEQLKKELTPTDCEDIIAQTAALEAFQEREDPLDVLPRITLDDVPPAPQEFPLTQHQVGNLTCFHHACFTNGIVYASVHYDLPEVTDEELPYVELLTSMLPEVGAGGRDYKAQLDYLMAHTGGIGVDVALCPQASDPNHFRPSLSISGKALDHNAPALFGLFKDLLTSSDFSDTDRLKELLLQTYTELEHALSSSGMRYATSLATSALSPAARVGDAWRGLRFFHTVREIATDLEAQLPLVQHRLSELRDRLLRGGSGHLVLSSTQEQLQTGLDADFWGVGQLEPNQNTLWHVPLETNVVPNQGRIIAAPVAFTCQAQTTIPYAHRDAAALALSARLFDHTTLHPLVREKGGAYGSGAAYSATSGLFYFYSYRDPNLASTLKAFETARQKIVAGQFSDDELEQAKLTFIQKADTPVSPGSRAGVAYSWCRSGKSLAMRQAFRSRLLAMTKDEIVDAVSCHLPAKGKVVTLAGEELLKREAPLLDIPLDVLPA